MGALGGPDGCGPVPGRGGAGAAELENPAEGAPEDPWEPPGPP